jgi:hypothetical protein
MQRPNKKKGGTDSQQPADPEDNSKCRRVVKKATSKNTAMALAKAMSLFGVLVLIFALVLLHDASRPWNNGRYSLRMAEKQELGKQAAQYLVGKSTDSISERDRFVVALSGGSMPKLLKSGIEQVPGNTCE